MGFNTQCACLIYIKTQQGGVYYALAVKFMANDLPVEKPAKTRRKNKQEYLS